MLRKLAESAIPGGPIIGATIEHAIKHPYRVATGIGAIGLVGYAGLGFYQGKFGVDVGVETEIVTEDQGRGTIVDIDLEIPERPLVGFTADVVGQKMVLSREFGGKVGPVTLPNISLGENGLTLDNRVESVVCYDPSLITAQYDPGMIEDETDDRVILSVPLDALCVENNIDPTHEDPEFSGDIFSLPANYVKAFTGSFNFLKDVPGLKQVDGGVDDMEQTMLSVSRVQMLSNVAETCTTKVMENTTVNKAAHNNIAKAALEVIASSNDPALMDLTVRQISEMEVVTYIGAESDAQPSILNQNYNFTNPYTESIDALKDNTNLKFESQGEFECEISDEVKEMLGESEDAAATPTPSPEATNE